jgi:hypothetical protein
MEASLVVQHSGNSSTKRNVERTSEVEASLPSMNDLVAFHTAVRNATCSTVKSKKKSKAIPVIVLAGL